MGALPQFGWATLSGFKAVTGYSANGVGDDKHSWGIDGQRAKKIHGQGSGAPFGTAWATGDVIGLAVDIAGQTISASVNGSFSDPCGAAFAKVPFPADGVGIVPALSGQSGLYRVFFGPQFKHAPPDASYVAVADAKM